MGRFDYVVVGAGSAGCVLANRLSADPDVSVLLLEAGGQDDYIWIRIPVGYLYTINNPRTDWCFKTEAEAGLNGRSLGYPRGRVLGGCSSINGMIYMRGQARDYDGWRQLGCTGWGWDDVLPYFKAHEDFAWGADELHAEGGELRVEGMRISWEILDAFADAAEQAGIPRTADFNRGSNEGVGYFQVNQRRGRRWNTADAFLRPAESRPNLTVLTQAQAQQLELDGRRVTGVRFWHHGADARVAADGEVILATGSVGSPQLLQLSGLGPGELLRDRGLPVVHENPNVGENLQDHLQIRAVYSVVGVDTLNRRANSWLGKAGMALEYALFRRGPMTMAPSQLGCFTRSDPSRETPNLEYHVQPLSTDQLGDPLHPFPGITASVCNLRPESRGYVRIRDADPRTYPAIKPNYLATPADRQVAADALKLTRRIMGQPAMRKYDPQERKPGPDVESDADLARAAGDIGTTIFHPVGTCAMGPDPATSVVDPRLCVHGIAGLRVVDASVMPRITSGNTNAPTIMIAEKAAAMIREDRKVRARAAE
ncbi:choline dehydrogenase [Rhodovibrio sodomensis]|uniref:Choline dehydrogenase n=1 Tax=Rhodovibrio sodomensis TaxID=1088 RepID=A0ABS1DML6_9PROT|nr:GMC family oxidoreductase N-terminal domain-containing protein [Rhodovibrio sodomensis]MBK1670973.1 choline dehydrogenase [Rhodovibrio sodomensis]